MAKDGEIDEAGLNECAAEMLKIAEKYGLMVNIFLSGKKIGLAAHTVPEWSAIWLNCSTGDALICTPNAGELKRAIKVFREMSEQLTIVAARYSAICETVIKKMDIEESLSEGPPQDMSDADELH